MLSGTGHLHAPSFQAMRCFYCSREGIPPSEEHVPSKFLGSRLKTRRVCTDCNKRAAAETDNHFASYSMVPMPRALADVRSIMHQATPPSIELDAVVSATGEPVRVSFTPSGREVRRVNGERVREVIEISYGLGSDLWVRFTAKVALGCAAKLLDDNWLDSRLARGLQNLLWHQRIDPLIWPAGVPGLPGELADDHLLRECLTARQHLIGFQWPVHDPDAVTAIAVLFGGELVCQLPVPGLPCDGSGSVWVIDWSLRAIPRREDYNAAVERLLRVRGWSNAQIDAVRLP
jgi:hypothetical protein